MKQGIGALEAACCYLLPEGIALSADADGVLSQLRAEDSLDKQYGLERRDVDIVEEAPEPPAYALACHAESAVDVLAVRPPQDHPAWIAGPQFHPQFTRLQHLLQCFQKFLVLLSEFHV